MRTKRLFFDGPVFQTPNGITVDPEECQSHGFNKTFATEAVAKATGRSLSESEGVVERAMSCGEIVSINWDGDDDFTRDDFVAEMRRAGFDARCSNSID